MHDAKHAIATTSCTTGLHLILVALGIGPEDEIIVPTFTWVSTANVVMYCGAKPVFVDIDPNTFNIDPLQVASKISKNTKAIIAVHLFGLCADIDAIKKIAPNIPIIEDAACAAGGIYKNRSAGSLGIAAAFSFHPRKSITTGEGGMVTTNDDDLSELITKLRNHGASISEEQRHRGPKPYILPEFNMLGFNYRMTDLQGAVGSVQIDKLNSLINERAKWAAYYRENLKELEWLNVPDEPLNGRHAWQAFVTYVKADKAPISRNQIMHVLEKQGISTRPGTHAVHMLGFYRDKFNIQSGEFPVATECDKNSMAIPLHNRMEQKDYKYVIESIRQIK